MLDLFKVSNQNLIARLDDLQKLKDAADNDSLGFFNVKYPASGAEARIPVYDIEPLIRQQLMLVKEELRRRFG